MTSLRESAKARGLSTFYGKMCKVDGSRLYNTETGKCMECETYTHAIQRGHIVGTPGAKIIAEEPPEWWVRKEKDRAKKIGQKIADTKYRRESGLSKKPHTLLVKCKTCNGMGITGKSAENTLRECRSCKGNGRIEIEEGK